MADELQDDVWPKPAFHFSVTFSHGVSGRFQQVDGVERETQGVEHHRGAYPVVRPKAMPDFGGAGNVTLRKGIFINDGKFRNWYEEIKSNTIKPGEITLTLLDDKGAPKMIWTLHNARPISINAIMETDEVAVEALKIAFATLTATEL